MKQESSILKHFFTFSGFTLLSRILGFVRDVLSTHFLGTSRYYALFIYAYKLTNWFRRFFAEGALNVSLIPELIKHQNRPEKFQTLAQNTFSLILFTLGAFVLFMEIVAPLLAPLMMPKSSSVELAHLILLIQLNLPYALLISLCAVCSAVLNTGSRFYAESALPIILNLSVISSVLLFRHSSYQIMTIGMSLGVVIAGMIQLSWLYILCKKHHFKFKFKKPRLYSDETSLVMKKVGKNSLIPFAHQMNLFVDLYLAGSFLPRASIIYLFMADRINQFPLSMVGVALSVVLLPNFSKNIHDPQKTQNLFHNALIGALQLALPVSFIFVLLAEPIFYILFFHGKYTLIDTLQSARTLKFYAFGIPFVIVSKIFLSFLFANSISKIPLYAAIVSVGINVTLSVLLIPYMSHCGIAIATSLAACVNLVCLVTYSYKKFPYLFEQYKDVIKLIIWSVVNFILFYGIKWWAFPEIYDSFFHNLISIATLGMLFSGIYFILGYRLGLIIIPYKATKQKPEGDVAT